MKPDDNVLIIATADDAKDLDAALLRRFEMFIDIPKPNLNERAEILTKLLSDNRENIDAKWMSKLTRDFMAADLFDIFELARKKAFKVGRRNTSADDIYSALDDIKRGSSINYQSSSEAQKLKLAIKEAGSAIMSFYSKGPESIT